ncbi:hypothetical protein KCU93_g88, partial [Aureobasidium melanogenum]
MQLTAGNRTGTSVSNGRIPPASAAAAFASAPRSAESKRCEWAVSGARTSTLAVSDKSAAFKCIVPSSLYQVNGHVQAASQAGGRGCCCQPHTLCIHDSRVTSYSRSVVLSNVQGLLDDRTPQSLRVRKNQPTAWPSRRAPSRSLGPTACAGAAPGSPMALQLDAQ